MASFYKRPNSPFYWIRRRGPLGDVERVSSGIRIHAPGALRRIQQRVIDERQKEQRLAGDGAGALFREWVESWISYHYANAKTAARARNAWAWISLFLEEKGIVHPEEVTYAILHEYMRWRTEPGEGQRRAAWNTALLEVRMFGTILQEAVARGWLVANPCARLRLGRRNTKEKRPITRAEEMTWLPKLEGWMRDAFIVGVRQGCRLSEVAVPMDRVDLAAGVLVFRVKGGGLHAAPLHPDVRAIAERRLAEGADVLVELGTHPSKAFCQFFDAAGAPEISFHCLRVTVVTRLAQAGVPESKAMQYVGHASRMVHDIYRKLRASDVSGLTEFL